MTTKRTNLLASLASLTAAFAVLTTSSVALAQTSKSKEWKAPARAARKKNPVGPTLKSVHAGKQLFQQMCAVCHGPKAKGNGPAAVGLKPKPQDLTSKRIMKLTDGDVFWKIRVGRTPMPTFGTVLKQEQVWDLVNYIRTLGPKPVKSPKPITGKIKAKSGTSKSSATGTITGGVREGQRETSKEMPAKSAKPQSKLTKTSTRTVGKSR